MDSVAVRILHPTPAGVGPLEAALLAARAANADRLARLFADAGAEDVQVVAGGDAGPTFAARVRSALQPISRGGVVLLGSGALPLADVADAARFVEVAGSGARRALANNRYSADVIAVGDAGLLADLPELPGDNALPRWLAEVAGVEVEDLRTDWRLQVDLDSPLDILLTGGPRPDDLDAGPVDGVLEAVRAVAGDRRSELVVAGRTSAGTLAWLERAAASRVRALIEERGLRASTVAAMAGADPASVGRGRAPASVLGMVLDDRGPDALASVLSQLGDAAIVDTRVLLAHRLGVAESTWPRAEDRFASDLLLPDHIADPWLRQLTASAIDAPIPILLGAHTLVGPGLRLALGERAAPAR
ncbi:MAG TPA: hypothetical protein VGI98_05855 [Candidatus Limnocylindrales bacterium]